MGEEGTIEMRPDMILKGGPYDYTNMIIEPSFFSCDDIGEHTITVTDTITENSCWGVVNVVDIPLKPLSIVTITGANISPDTLYPAFIAANTEYTLGKVYPIDAPCFPADIVVTYIDVVFDLEGGDYKILRTFSVLDNDTNEVTECVQVVKYFNQVDLTCAESLTISVGMMGISPLTPDMFLEAGQIVENASLNIEEITCADVSDTLTISVTGLVDGQNASCESSLIIVDNAPPVTIAYQNLNIFLNEDGEASLSVVDVNNGSWDNCTAEINLNMTLSKEPLNPDEMGEATINFTTDDIGNNIVYFRVYDEQGNYNETWVYIEVFGLGQALACNSYINVSVDASGEAVLTPDNLLEGGPYDFDLMIIEPSMFTCDDIGEEITVTVTDTTTGQSCWGEVNIEDKIAPIPIVFADLVLALSANEEGDEATGKLYAESVDNSSFDNCTASEDLIYEPLYWEFGCSDIGLHEITLTIYDESGNSSSAMTSVLVENKLDEVSEIFCPDDILVDCGLDLNDPDVIENILGGPSFDVQAFCANVNYQDVNSYDQNSDGDIDDVFEVGEAQIHESYNQICGFGTITRQWTAINGLGCTQYIYIEASGEVFNGSTIDWPYTEDLFFTAGENDGQTACNGTDLTTSVSVVSVTDSIATISIECLDEVCETPLWENLSCNLIGYNVLSDTFYFEESYCAVIHKHYTIIDWCTTNEYRYTVVAQFTDDTDPVIESADTEISTSCGEGLTVSAYIGPDSSGCVLAEYKLQMWVDYFSDWTEDLEISSWSPIDLGNASSPLWDDDDGNGVPDISVGNPGGIDNVNSNTISNDFLYQINLPSDVPITNDDEEHRILWKLTDACGNVTSHVSYFTVISNADDDVKKPTPYCINLSTALLSENEQGGFDVTLYAIDFNLGSFDNCTAQEDLRYTYTDTPPSEDEDYDPVFRSSSMLIENPGGGVQTFTIYQDIYVWDESNNFDYCTVEIAINVLDCPPFSWEDDVTYPLSLIELDAIGIDPNELTPEQLNINFGFAVSDVEPTYTECWSENMYAIYTDLVFEVGDGIFKIIREWSILNWLTQDVIEYTQLIKNYSELAFICDTLPRSADVVDCAFGHTLEDDVEWPNDLPIEDHRITPEELVAFSNVDVLDAEPSFYNTPEEYVATYVDLLGPLSPDELVIYRDWTVTRLDINGLSWEYRQTITVDLSVFEPLISTQTFAYRAIPNVTVATGVETDEFGLSVIEENGEYNPSKLDLGYNGLTVKDIVLTRNHILGVEELTLDQQLAADISDDNSLTAIDIVTIQKVILGIDAESSTEWKFFERSSGLLSDNTNSLQYLGVKPGDVDDDAVFTSLATEDPEALMYADDQVLNAGETHVVEIKLDEAYDCLGLQASFLIDTDLATVLSVSTPAFDNETSNFNVTDSGEFNIVSYTNGTTFEQIGNGEVVFRIELFALQNTTLVNVLSIQQNRNSYVLDGNKTLIPIGAEVENVLPSGSEDIVSNHSINFYPNPTTDWLNIDIADYTETLESIELFNVIGEKVLEIPATDRIDLSHLSPGVYSYVLHFENSLLAGKIQVAR